MWEILLHGYLISVFVVGLIFNYLGKHYINYFVSSSHEEHNLYTSYIIFTKVQKKDKNQT